MGRERDYDAEYERERGKQYKKKVSWSGLAEEEGVYEFTKLTPAPPGYYKKRQVTKNSLSVMEGYQGAAIKPQFYSLDDRAESPTQNQQKQDNPTRGQRKPDKQQPPQTQKKPNWFQRIFGGGKDKQKQPGRNARGHVKNRTPRSHRSGKPKDTPAVAGFKQKLKTSAHTELDKNQQQLDGLREQYITGKHSKQSLDNLREEVTLLARYEEKEQEILGELSWVSNDPGAAALNSQAYDPEAFERLQNELVEVKQARAALLKQFPVAGLLTTEQVEKELVSDRRLVQILSRKFDGIERDIKLARFGIDNGDVPLSELDGIIPSVSEQIPEQQRAEVSAYIKKKKQTEATVQAGTAGAEVLLTLFGVFSGGGVLSSIYYGVAGALGLGTAAYEFERAADLNTIANAGNAGGTQLLSDPEQAKRNYIFAWANLTLGLVDSGLAITEGGQLLKGAKAAEKLATRPNSQAIFNLASDDVLAIQRAVDLERAGDPAAQQTLAALKQELGSDFDAVYDTLSDSNLSVVGNVEAELYRGGSISDLPDSPSRNRLREIREGLTPEGQALFDKEFTASNSNADAYLFDLESKKDPTKYLNGRGAAEAKRARGGQQQTAQQRTKNAFKQLKESGFINRADVLKVVNDSQITYAQKIDSIRSKIAVEQAKNRAIAKYPASQGYEVLEEVDVVEVVGNYKSIDEWLAVNLGKKPKGLYESGGRIWKKKTDIDVMVVQKTADAKYRTVEIQEIKSGKNDSPNGAKKQSNNGKDGLQAINNGSSDVQLHQDKNNITGKFNRSKISVGQDRALTIGPGQKKQGGTNGFDRVSDNTTNDYNNLAKEILKQHGVIK